MTAHKLVKIGRSQKIGDLYMACRICNESAEGGWACIKLQWANCKGEN